MSSGLFRVVMRPRPVPPCSGACIEPEPQPGPGRSEAAWNRNRSRNKEERCTTYQASECTVYREHCHVMPALSVFKRCSDGNVRPYHSRHLLCRNRDLYTLYHSAILACRNVVAADAIDVAELACTGFTCCTLASDRCVIWRKRASVEFQALKLWVP